MEIAPQLHGMSHELSHRVRQQMLGRGFSLVKTPRFFDGGEPARLRSRRTVLPFCDARWWKCPELARYACWLERLLLTALPEEPGLLASLEFRHEPADSVDEQVDRLHADGSYLRSVYALFGPATVYRDGDALHPVPPGRTLLMTGMDRARAVGVPCTLHRRPGAGPERSVVVCSFEPRPEETRLPDNYRRVTEAHAPHRGARRRGGHEGALVAFRQQ